MQLGRLHTGRQLSSFICSLRRYVDHVVASAHSDPSAFTAARLAHQDRLETCATASWLSLLVRVEAHELIARRIYQRSSDTGIT